MNIQVITTNTGIRYNEDSKVSLNDIITSSGEKYVVPDRKLGQVTNPPYMFSQSFPPHCPLSDEIFIGPKGLSNSHSTPDNFMSHFKGTSRYDGVLRKRSNENKNPSNENALQNDKCRSKSYVY